MLVRCLQVVPRLFQRERLAYFVMSVFFLHSVLSFSGTMSAEKEGGMVSDLPAKSILPVSISARMQPAAHMSMALV